MAKIGLVLEGGGLRGIYTAGVLDAMLEYDVHIEYVVGVSAGACNACTFVSRQPGRAGRVILDHFMDPRYLSYRNMLRHGSMFGMKFMFHDIPRKLDPFDFDTFESSVVDFEAGVTNLDTGKTEYYNKHFMRREDDFKVVQASSSIPLAARVVTFEGKRYLDGAIGDSIPVDRALAKGCDKVVVVLTQPPGFQKKPMELGGMRKWIYRKYPNFLEAMATRHTRYNRALETVRRMEREGTALVFQPQKPIPFSGFEKSPEGMHQLYEDGLADVRGRIQELRAFLGEESR